MKCSKDEKANKAQRAHKYCLEGDPVTKATDCFESVFAKVDTFLANQLCFEKGKDLYRYQLETLICINTVRGC